MSAIKKCKNCHADIADARHQLGYTTCLDCGDIDAKRVVHCIAPMHKSNYVVISNLEDLKGINNKGGFYK